MFLRGVSTILAHRSFSSSRDFSHSLTQSRWTFNVPVIPGSPSARQLGRTCAALVMPTHTLPAPFAPSSDARSRQCTQQTMYGVAPLHASLPLIFTRFTHTYLTAGSTWTEVVGRKHDIWMAVPPTCRSIFTIRGHLTPHAA